jgi:hypothetical protein
MPKRTNNNDASRGRWWCALQGMGSVDRRWSEGGATMNRHILKRKGGPVGSYMSNGRGGGVPVADNGKRCTRSGDCGPTVARVRRARVGGGEPRSATGE